MKRDIHKVLVANRGEIAIRTCQACFELGIKTVAVFADEADKAHLPYATEHAQLEKPGVAGFLDIEGMIRIAQRVKADAVHPGYGFLSESAEFALACEKNGLVFIGPSSKVIATVGDKISARAQAEKMDIPLVPGTPSAVSSAREVYSFARICGYPVMIKARDGGGGRGIRIVMRESDVEPALKTCLRESPSGGVFVEKAVVDAKHIEVQVIGDHQGNVVHLFERDCSVQRRFQKLVEIAPSPHLPSKIREHIWNDAVKLAKSIGYSSVGTIEFLYDRQAQQHYFLEVNPRIQVEHTITEEITGVDLLKSQVLVALGQSLPKIGIVQRNLTMNGSAIQCRIIAEDPAKNFDLSIGLIKDLQLASGPGIRVDTSIREGVQVTPFYDSMLVKVVTRDATYEAARAKALWALSQSYITGVVTNRELLMSILNHPSIISGDFNTRILEDHMEYFLKASSLTPPSSLVYAKPQSRALTAPPQSGTQFAPGTGFRISVNQGDRTSEHTLILDTISRNTFPTDFASHITLDNQPMTITVSQAAATNASHKRADPNNTNHIASPVTGMLVQVLVQEGDSVKAGDDIAIISAMKMETTIRASQDAHVLKQWATVGEIIGEGELIVELGDAKAKL